LRQSALAAAAFFAALQLVRPGLTNPPLRSEALLPPEIAQTIRTSCYDCHSNETQLRWFDQIVPAYWLVVKDVKDGRARLNFSELGQLPPAAQRAALFESLNQVRLGAMPPSKYLALHPSARVGVEQRRAWEQALAVPTEPRRASVTVTLPAARAEGTVTAAPNGVAFPADYVHWSPISATSRFDNGTVRLIVGNAVAMRAIADRRIHPWPDGASLVKVAWHVGADATPPRFVQLELMTKDARAHASTEGWGFARWRGDALVPYGKDASFERECTGCHEPVRDHDYVYTLPIGRGDGSDAWNAAAAWPADVSVNPRELGAIGASFDAAGGSIAITFGNALARQYARARGEETYAAGAVFARVSWSEQEDRQWFGARIPGSPRLVEVVKLVAGDQGGVDPRYESFDGSSGVRRVVEASSVDSCVREILGRPGSP
jgi:Haem-binding domain/Cytochrome P460